MADQTLLTLHPFLRSHQTPTPSGCTIHSYSHSLPSTPILILVHGYPQSSYMWRHVLPTWSKTHSLFIPELPGYGFSSAPPSADKRTLGALILSAFRAVFPDHAERTVVWVGHDRGARVGHRVLVDASTTSSSTIEGVKLRAAILMDIVPTWEQWLSFSRPSAAVTYSHWPFLATPGAAQLIRAMGAGTFVRAGLSRVAGKSGAGAESFRADGALEHYVAQFERDGGAAVEGSCADYTAGAGVDVTEQQADQREGRKVGWPTLVVYSAGNLGAMHDVKEIWPRWVSEGCDLKVVGVEGGFGHYLPEECPEKITELVFEWLDHVGAHR